MIKSLFGLMLSAFASAAIAADMPVPVYKAPAATVVSASGWYLSVDGAWQRVKLPDHALGFRQAAPAVFTDAGPMQSFRQRFDGFLVRGAVGYFWPGNATIFGANSRVEFGGFYSRASGTDTETVVSTVGGVITQFLDGTGANGGYICSPGQICTTNSNLATTHSNWQLHGKIAGDHRMGTVVVTPSLAVFGGNGRTSQTLTQVQTVSTSPNSATYNASTSLRWTDVGARAGIDLKLDVAPRATVGLSGWAGFARRNVSLSGTDVGTDNIVAALVAGSGTISASADATPFLANAEAGVAFRWLPAVIVRGFVGLNYDSKVPGVSSPSFAGSVGAVTSRTPAGVSFHSQSSYYAGGGVTWAFNSARP
jgi:hypothetical protein